MDSIENTSWEKTCWRTPMIVIHSAESVQLMSCNTKSLFDLFKMFELNSFQSRYHERTVVLSKNGTSVFLSESTELAASG